jgi:dienelactone hydrolase
MPHDPSTLSGERDARRSSPERERARPDRSIRRRRALAGGVLVLISGAVALTIALAQGRGGHEHGGRATPRSAAQSPGAEQGSSRTRPTSFAVGLSVLRLVDASRTIQLPNGTTEPRTLVTEVRYPAVGNPARTDVSGAVPARADGPFPLVVFGHGFAVMPALYARLLQSWAQAGYVVAAPVFPLESSDAPGGPDEADLTNQPTDMRFVISRMIAASQSSSGPLVGLIDPTRIAVAGQSDGGDTALAVADDPRFRDPRVGAVIVLSGAEIPGIGEFAFPRESPPLLATQGTADTVNPPSATSAFFDPAPRPKYLLSLLGAKHLPPYSDQQPQLGIVQRVTIAFLGGYLENSSSARRRLTSLGSVPGKATLLADP